MEFILGLVIGVIIGYACRDVIAVLITKLTELVRNRL